MSMDYQFLDANAYVLGYYYFVDYDTLKPAKTFSIGLDGRRVDNCYCMGGVPTDGGLQP